MAPLMRAVGVLAAVLVPASIVGAAPVSGPTIAVEANWQDPVPKSAVTGRAAKYVMQAWPDAFETTASTWARSSTVTVYDPQSDGTQNAPVNGEWEATTGPAFYTRLFSWRDTDSGRNPEPAWDLSATFPAVRAGAVGYRFTQPTAVPPAFARDIDGIRVEVFPEDDTGGILSRDATVSWLTPSPSSRLEDASSFVGGVEYETGRVRDSRDDPPEDPASEPQRMCSQDPVEPPGDYCIGPVQRLRPRAWSPIGANPGPGGQLVGGDEYHPGKGYAHFRLELGGVANPAQYVRYMSAQPRDRYPEDVHVRAYRAGGDGALGMNDAGQIAAGAPGRNRRSNEWELWFCRSGYWPDGAVVRSAAAVASDPWWIGAEIGDAQRGDPNCHAPYYTWSWGDRGEWRVYEVGDPTCRIAPPPGANSPIWLANLDPRVSGSDYHRYAADWGGPPQVRGQGPWDSAQTRAGRCWIRYPGQNAHTPAIPTATSAHQEANIAGGGGFRRGAWFYPGTRIGRVNGETVEWTQPGAPIPGAQWRWTWNRPGTGFGSAADMCHGLPAAESTQQYADADFDTATYAARDADGPALTACAGLATSSAHVVASTSFDAPGASYRWHTRRADGSCATGWTAWQDTDARPASGCVGSRHVLLRPVPRARTGTCPAAPGGARGVPGGPDGTWCVMWRKGHVDGHWYRDTPEWRWVPPRTPAQMSGRAPSDFGTDDGPCDSAASRLRCLIDLGGGAHLDALNAGCSLAGRQWSGTNVPHSPPHGDRGPAATSLGRWPGGDGTSEPGWYKARIGLPTTTASFPASGRCDLYVPGYVAPSRGRWVPAGPMGGAQPGFKTLSGTPTSWPRNNRLDAGGWRVFAALSPGAPEALTWRITSQQYAPRGQRWEWDAAQTALTPVIHTSVTALQTGG